MQITKFQNQNQNLNLNFKANIKFVSSKEFDSKMFRQFFYCGKPKEPYIKSFVKGVDIWTPDVRTCTAGGVVDNNDVLAFHLMDKPENIDSTKRTFADIIRDFTEETKSALLIGAKNIRERKDSVPLFESVKAEIKKIVTPSIFETHKNRYAESCVGYEKATDTWFINTSIPEHPMMPNKRIDVVDFDALQANFEDIKIAPQDRLFVGGKEITSEICPEIFVKLDGENLDKTI